MSGGFYKYRCKNFYTYNCTNWVYSNGHACADCLVCPSFLSPISLFRMTNTLSAV